MKIHSSSLATMPTTKRQAYKKSDSVQNPLALEPKPAISQIKKNQQATDLKNLSTPLTIPENKQISRRTSQALNAYIQENNRPITNQQLNLVSRVDFFA